MSQRGIDGYSYYISADSDEEVPPDSSDEEVLDEINVFLRGTSEQKRKAFKNLTGDEASSSDDDFEKVMQGELEAKVSALENSWKSTVKGNSEGTSRKDSDPSAGNYYDDIYFDSDEEKTTEGGKKQKMTNDELLYDPKADEEDQKWIDRRRSKRKNTDGGSNEKPSNAGNSDATLTCPACMTTLCVDCQRHSIYQNQYRAMFVMNCDVKYDELLHYKTKKKKEFKRHKKQKDFNVGNDAELSSSSFTKTENTGENSSDGYHPVICSTCKTEVAVYDSNEIYHFFNVLSGYA